MAEARRFYIDLLGYEIEWEPDEDSVYLSSGRDNLALHRGDVGDLNQRLDHLGIILSKAEDVFAWETHLKKHGVEIAQGAKTHRDGATSCYVKDPAGTLVQFLHHPPISPTLHRI
jgi:catechol 2,3-dioxygenase-like lactoylglutathione lyase family enzyme